MTGIFFRLFYFVLICFCVLDTFREVFFRWHPHAHMGSGWSLLVATIIGALLIAPEVVKFLKRRA